MNIADCLRGESVGRLRRESGRHALVDGIPFTLPVASHESPALMAASRTKLMQLFGDDDISHLETLQMLKHRLKESPGK